MIHQLIDRAQISPQRLFLAFEDETYTFSEMAELALKGSTWLENKGIQRGDNVLLAVGNRPLFLFYWFALLARGAIVVPINPELFGDGLRYIATQSKSTAILTDATTEHIQTDLAELPITVLAIQNEASFIKEVHSLELAQPAEINPGDSVIISYTSGTTGLPKGVVIPLRSYTAIGQKISSGIGITQEDRVLTFLPLYHANPQMYSIMSALTVGCSIALVERFSSSRFLEQVEKLKPTGFTYVGTVLSILNKTIEKSPPASLRWCVGGGAPQQVWEELAARWNIKIHELYGMTETGGMVTMNTTESYRMGSVGRIRDDFEVVLLDENDEYVTDGVGEIAVRPKVPHIMMSTYFNKPDEVIDSMSNLWFHTGDIGRFDNDGYLYFEGRKKELIRRAGEMISPVAIELAALKHHAISDCAAVGVEDEIYEEEIKLVVVAHEALEAEEIVDFLSAKLPKHMLPRYIEFTDAIPKTASQKVQRFKLTAQGESCVDMRTLKTA